MAKRIVGCRKSCKKPIVSTSKCGILIALLALLPILLWDASSALGQERTSVSGITEPIEDVTLSLNVAGTISGIYFKEGALVGKGQTILELNNRVERLEVKRRKVLWESKAEVESAAARVATTKSLLGSTRELFDTTGSVSKEELEKLELEYKLSVAEQKRLEIEEQRQRVEYEMALANLHKRRLTSPIEGVIIKLFLDKGESCEPQQPLVQVVDTSKGLFVCNVEEWLGRTLRKGNAVDLKIRTGSELMAKKGKVVFVSPVVDPASGLLEVKAEFENRDGAVRPGVEGFMFLVSPQKSSLQR